MSGGRISRKVGERITYSAGRMSGPDQPIIPYIEGDGTGPDIWKATSRVLEMRGQTMIERSFNPGFRVDLHRKDLAIALASGRNTATPLPVTALVSQMYDAVSANGGGQLDHSALITIIDLLSGGNA